MTLPHAATGAATLVPPVSSAAHHRPILVAADGTETCAPALLAARLLAGKLGAPVRVVSIVPPERAILPTPEGIALPVTPVAELVARRRDLVRTTLAEVLGAVPDWPLEVRTGIVPLEVADIGRETNAQLVVTGLVHHGRLDRALRGEVPLGIMHESRLPTLAVPPGTERLPRNLLVAVDLTDASVDAASYVRPLAQGASAVYLVHVRTPVDVAPPMMAPDADRAYDESLTRAFARVAAALELPPTVHVERKVFAGSVAYELLDFAETAKIDMIVAGHRRRGLLERLFAGGTAARLFHGARTWLLMVPEDARHRERLEMRSAEDETNLWLRDRAAWPAFLDEFTRRNSGRRVELQVHDPLGAQTVVAGYPFLGIDYEPESGGVDVMLGDATGTERHLRHTVRRATALEVHRAPNGRDGALRIGDRYGQVLLTLAP